MSVCVCVCRFGAPHTRGKGDAHFLYFNEANTKFLIKGIENET